MTPLEQIGRLALEALKAQTEFIQCARLIGVPQAKKHYEERQVALNEAIAAHNASKPVDDLSVDTIESIKNRFRLADPDTEFRQDQLLRAIDDAFRAGQSSSEDSRRLLVDAEQLFSDLEIAYNQSDKIIPHEFDQEISAISAIRSRLQYFILKGSQ
jgi:hypothetical protein